MKTITINEAENIINDLMSIFTSHSLYQCSLFISETKKTLELLMSLYELREKYFKNNDGNIEKLINILTEK